MFKIPKNDGRFVWTNHVVGKMMFYGLSAQKIKSILSNYKRKEEGIAPDTIAVMQPAGSKKRPSEIWVMYQRANQKSKVKNQNFGNQSAVKIISAWRYPGTSPAGKRLEIPEDVLAELENFDRGGAASEI